MLKYNDRSEYYEADATVLADNLGAILYSLAFALLVGIGHQRIAGSPPVPLTTSTTCSADRLTARRKAA